MGISGLFSFLQTTFPDAFRSKKELLSTSSQSGQNSPNSNEEKDERLAFEVDYGTSLRFMFFGLTDSFEVCIDVMDLLHFCMRTNWHELFICQTLVKELERIITFWRPRKGVLLALDGPGKHYLENSPCFFLPKLK